MKITSFDIERFGLWSGLKVPKLSHGLNVFYGANEAGKSTLMEFIRCQLYGFGDERRRFARKPSNIRIAWNAEVDHEGRSLYVISGGAMQMDSPSGRYRLRRMFQPGKPLGNEEEVELRTLDGKKESTQLLRVLVSGVDEATFNNVFAIGLDELQKLGSLSDTEAAEMLFRLSVGMDRVSIVDAGKEITNRRNKILCATEKENKPSRLPQLLRQREKLGDAIAESKLKVREYARLRNELHAVDRSVTIFEEDLAKLEREKRIHELAASTESVWRRRDKLRKEIDGMGTVTAVSEAVMEELEKTGKNLDERKSSYNRLREEFRKARDAVRSQAVNETLWKQTPRIEVLLEEEKRIVEIDALITGLETEIAEREIRLQEEESQLQQGRRSLPLRVAFRGKPPRPQQETEPTTTQTDEDSGNAAARPHVMEPRSLEDFRIPARAVSKTKKRVHRIKEEHADLTGRVKVLNEKVKSELARHDFDDLNVALETAGESITHLRRRQDIAKRLAEMASHHKELHRINAFLVQHQALPSWALGFIGLACVAGAIPVGFALFGALGLYEETIPPLLTLLGLSVIFAAVAIYVLSGKNNARKLQQNQRQLSILLAQLDHAKQEAAAIDARYPGSIGGGPTTASIELRFQEAQQTLAQLEKLVPVETQRREVSAKLRQLDLRLQRCKDEHGSAARRWNDWLRMAGLPADWTPGQVRALIEQTDTVGDLKKELDSRYDLLSQRTREMRGITDRIDRMIDETGLAFEDGLSYVDILKEIRRKLEENETAVQAREKLKSGIKELLKMRQKAVANLRKAKQARIDLLRQFNVKKAEQLVELHRRHLKHRKLLQQEQGVQRELDAALGGFCDESIIAALLQPRLERRLLAEAMREATEPDDVLDDEPNELLSRERGRGVVDGSTTATDGNRELQIDAKYSLNELLDDINAKIAIKSTKLHEELEQRGKLTEQLRLIAEDKTTLQKQRELAVVEEQIEQARREWQSYAVCARMLDAIRETYERERQPRTLAEASILLRNLTDEKYLRIWTPLGEETLLVDDDKGDTYDVAWLSRGTREQLFIALRLALASAFAQHGTLLPIVLDDVLVNFDSKRAFAAARMLVEFAQSDRQIFLFTCHEHVCRMFQKLDVPVRILPPVDKPEQPTRVLLPRSVLKRRAAARRREAERRARYDEKQRLEMEIARREESIRREALRKAEVQRLVLQMQQIATAEKALEADKREQ